MEEGPSARRQLLRIREAALDEESSLSGALRQCLSLASDTGSSRLTQWATSELKGYKAGDDLPDYRTVGAPLYMDGVTPGAIIRGQRLHPDRMPSPVDKLLKEQASLYGGIPELIAAIRQARLDGNSAIRLTHPQAGLISGALDRASKEAAPGQSVQEVYWEVHLSAFEGVVEHVRTALVELANELLGSAEAEHTPVGPEVDEAVSIVIGGDRNIVNVVRGSDQTVTAASGDNDAVPSSGSGIKDFFSGTAAQVVGGLILALLLLVGSALGIRACEDDPPRDDDPTTTTPVVSD